MLRGGQYWIRSFLIYFLWWDAPTCIGQKSKVFALNKFFILLPIVETSFIKKNVNNCWILVSSNVLIKTSCCIAQIIYIAQITWKCLLCKAGYAGYTVWVLYPWYCTRIHPSVNYLLKLAVAESFYCHFFFILLLSWCDAGILVNKDGIPEEEENFDEAIRAVNMALVPTRVRSLEKSISIKLCCSFRTTLFCQLLYFSWWWLLYWTGFSTDISFRRLPWEPLKDLELFIQRSKSCTLEHL